MIKGLPHLFCEEWGLVRRSSCPLSLWRNAGSDPPRVVIYYFLKSVLAFTQLFNRVPLLTNSYKSRTKNVIYQQIFSNIKNFVFYTLWYSYYHSGFQ
jgi:hypothetical protein